MTRRAAIGAMGAIGLVATTWRLRANRALDRLAELRFPVPWYRKRTETTYTVCDMCPWRCGVVVTTVAGRAVKIDGNPNDPKSNGMLCAKGQAGASFAYDPDRLKTPLIRTGERGAGEFREASWDEALDLIAERMQDIAEEDGPESIAFLGHTSGDTGSSITSPRHGVRRTLPSRARRCARARARRPSCSRRLPGRRSRTGRLGRDRRVRADRLATSARTPATP